MCFLVVVEVQKFCEPFIQFSSISSRVQINVVLFHSAPQTFDENVIRSSSFAIHADLDLLAFQIFRPQRTGELTTLVRIYYVRFTIARNCLFQDSQAVLCLPRIVQVPAYHKPTVQVDNGSEIHEPMSHRYRSEERREDTK